MLASGLCLALFAAPSYAFSDDEARRAILELREQLRQMTEQNNRARLQLANQVQALQQEAMQLRNQLELVTSQQSASGGQLQSPHNPAGVQADDPQEQAAFDAAIDQFRTAHYQQASQALTDFISLYPSSPLAPTALFYQGSSRYALKDYKGAIDQMQVLIQAAPDNPRAPDALLVIAGSQIETNDRAGAKTTLQRLVRDYPNAEAAGTAKDRLQLLQ
jgi:tol-pal system protein YbgF